MITRRRRLALYIQSWLYKVAFWLDVHTAPKYDGTKWPTWELSNEDFANYMDSIERDCE
jgi:hypothetical protein